MAELFNNSSKSDEYEIRIVEIIEKIIKMMENITEFRRNELNAISIVMTDKYLREYVDFMLSNKKHVKRRHSKEILDALEKISDILSKKTPELNMVGGSGLFR